LKGYTDFIELVEECNEETDIYVKEIDDRPFHFKKIFYDAIKNDLNVIKTNIDDIRVTTSDSVQDINDNIDKLKKTKINDFLKEGNNGLIYMIRSKAKYNENSNNNYKANLASVSGKTVAKVRSATFHFIATTYFRVDMREVNMEGGGGSPAKIQKNMDLIFDMDPKYVYLEDNSKFDANLSLFKELYKLYEEPMDHTDFHFISLYSECLYRLSIKPDYTSENLSELVGDIFDDFRKFEKANAELETDASPTGIAEFEDKHISSTDKPRHTTIFKEPIYNKTRGRRGQRRDSKTTGRRGQRRDSKTTGRRSRSRSRDRRRSRSRDSRSRSRDIRSRSRSRSRDRRRDSRERRRTSKYSGRRSRSRNRMILV